MDSSFDFDNALSSQRIFKCVMDAFSHPFQQFNINNGSKQDFVAQEKDTFIKQLCSVFLDTTVTFYVHGDDAFAGDIAELTYSRHVDIEDADFVIIKKADDFVLWEKIFHGTLFDPHKGATVIVALPQIAGDMKITAAGPGIDGEITCFVHPDIKRCLSETAKLGIEYPMGYELLFVAESGDICAAPRRVNAFREVV